ncbi:hypothetical protein TNCV_1555751 [Trichonephila clavipes]|nr:hypothetical protein TNCV_1555751 [Trichonephila clavipes]
MLGFCTSKGKEKISREDILLQLEVQPTVDFQEALEQQQNRTSMEGTLHKSTPTYSYQRAYQLGYYNKNKAIEICSKDENCFRKMCNGDSL